MLWKVALLFLGCGLIVTLMTSRVAGLPTTVPGVLSRLVLSMVVASCAASAPIWILSRETCSPGVPCANAGF